MVVEYEEMTDQERREFNSQLLHLVINYQGCFNSAKEMIAMGKSRNWFAEINYDAQTFKVN